MWARPAGAPDQRNQILRLKPFLFSNKALYSIVLDATEATYFKKY